MSLTKSKLNFVLVVFSSLFALQVQAVDPPKVERVINDNASHEKLVIGEAEYIDIPALKATFNARIDTGAATTSVFAANIEEFERDGKPWVRFTVMNPDQKKEYPLERPVARVARIKKRGEDGFTRRPAVAADLTLGKVTRQITVNLADRTGFEFPLLIGRDFLRGLAVVDVSKKYTQKSSDSAVEKP
ncbi:MAG: ATP-dependent zinc protease [Gammaproteobacteria bacterium]|nr:ATP-dependent zinc protease [Gammaproteobacteria bacterium]